MQWLLWISVPLHAQAMPCHALSCAMGCVLLQVRVLQQQAGEHRLEARAHNSLCGFCTATPMTAEQRRGLTAAQLLHVVELSVKLRPVAPCIMPHSRMLGA